MIKDIAGHLPAIQVIVFSMHEEVFYAERALRAGARGYVAKSESTDRVVEAIRAVRKGELYASATLLARLAERMVGRAPSLASDSVEVLSDRELDVFRRLGEGQTTRRIAEEFKSSPLRRSLHFYGLWPNTRGISEVDVGPAGDRPEAQRDGTCPPHRPEGGASACRCPWLAWIGR